MSMEFSRQENWGGSPFPLPGDLPDPGIGPVSLVCPVLAGGFFIIALPGKWYTKMLTEVIKLGTPSFACLYFALFMLNICITYILIKQFKVY